MLNCLLHEYFPSIDAYMFANAIYENSYKTASTFSTIYELHSYRSIAKFSKALVEGKY